MANEIDIGTVSGWYDQLKGMGFEEFRTFRRAWDDLINRELKPVLDKRFGTYFADYQTADLEEAMHDVADVLTLNPTRFAGVPGDQKQGTLDDMHDFVLWDSRTWAIENRDRWIDRYLGIGQAARGAAGIRMLYHPVKEPEAKDDQGREEAFKNRPHPFYFEKADILGMGWLPADKPEVIALEVEMPALMAEERLATKGEMLGDGYDKGKNYIPYVDTKEAKIKWRGEGEPPDYPRQSQSGKSIKVLTVEYLNRDLPCPVCADGHPLWCGVEYVTGGGQAIGDSTCIQKYVLPYKHWGSLRIVAGRKADIYADPHRKYRPLLYRMLVEATIINWGLSMLQLLANKDAADEGEYMDASRLDPALANRLFDELVSKGFGIPKPDPGKNEWAVVWGEIKKRPSEAAEYFVEMIKLAQMRFEAARPSRFILGKQSEAELRDSTATSQRTAVEQSRAPFSYLLSQSDGFILDAKEDQRHAMRLWAHQTGVEQDFYVTLTGEEQVSGESEAGRSVKVNATKAGKPFELTLVTKNETMAERAQTRQEALAGYQAGVMDEEQVLEAWGFYDSKAQFRKLEKSVLRRLVKPQNDMVLQQVYSTILASVADIDPMLLSMGPQQMGASPSPGQGGGPDAASLQPKGQVQLGPLSRPEGGTSPVQEGALV